MTLLRGAAYTLVVAAAGVQVVRPVRTNPATDPSHTLFAHVAVPPAAAAVLDRACRDCHSHDTRWPWYSNVAPVSWWVIDHVNHGRSHFNYSNWTQYRRDEAEKLLKNSCELARKGSMPLPQYVWMHSAARLTPRDIDALCRWVENGQPN